jgi:DNA primase
MSIPQSFVQELIARADVVEIVGSYVQLKKGGANFMGLCPFHSEKSPRSRSVRQSSSTTALVAEKPAMPSVF